MLKKSFYFFMSVVETGSFSQAAKKHYLSQAAISQQISKLEEEVGIAFVHGADSVGECAVEEFVDRI